MAYPPGVAQWHVDYYAGGYDMPRYTYGGGVPNPDPYAADEEPDYDAELDWESLVEVAEIDERRRLDGGRRFEPGPERCYCEGGELICSPDCCRP